MTKVFNLLQHKGVHVGWKVCAQDGAPDSSGTYLCFLMDEAEDVIPAVMDWVEDRGGFSLTFPQPIPYGIGVIAYHRIESPVVMIERTRPN